MVCFWIKSTGSLLVTLARHILHVCDLIHQNVWLSIFVSFGVMAKNIYNYYFVQNYRSTSNLIELILFSKSLFYSFLMYNFRQNKDIKYKFGIREFLDVSSLFNVFLKVTLGLTYYI